MSVGLQRLRDEPDRIRRGATDKGEDPALVDRALALDERRRALTAEGDALKAERNASSKRIGEAIRGGADANGPEVADLKAASARVGERIDAIDAELATVDADLQDVMLRIPNPADPTCRSAARRRTRSSAPGASRCPAGIAARTGRSPRRWASSTCRVAPRSPAPAFPVYVGAGSALQRGLINWFLDVHTRENGMTELWPPAVVNADSARGTGQIPDKEDQMYVVERDGLYLVPTAEVPVTNLHRDEILDAGQLPCATPPTRPASAARPAPPDA
jgi:seryl-tRNA synthetase